MPPQIALGDEGPITCVLLGRLGDLITATAVLNALAERYGAARIQLVLSAGLKGVEPLLKPGFRYAWVHRWYWGPRSLGAWRMLRRRSAAVIDLNPSPSKSAAALVALAKAGLKLGFRKKRLNFVFTRQVDAPKDDEPMLERYRRLTTYLDAPYRPWPAVSVYEWDQGEALKALEAGGFLRHGRTNVVVHPGNFKKYDNRWPRKNFIALVDRLQEQEGTHVYYLAGPGERSQVEALARAAKKPVTLLPPADLLGTAAMLKHMDILVCNITGTTHLAHAIGLPTFGLYSGYTNTVWRPSDARCGGVVSREWTSCRSIGVEEAWLKLRHFMSQFGKK